MLYKCYRCKNLIAVNCEYMILCKKLGWVKPMVVCIYFEKKEEDRNGGKEED